MAYTDLLELDAIADLAVAVEDSRAQVIDVIGQLVARYHELVGEHGPTAASAQTVQALALLAAVALERSDPDAPPATEVVERHLTASTPHASGRCG